MASVSLLSVYFLYFFILCPLQHLFSPVITQFATHFIRSTEEGILVTGFASFSLNPAGVSSAKDSTGGLKCKPLELALSWQHNSSFALKHNTFGFCTAESWLST